MVTPSARVEYYIDIVRVRLSADQRSFYLRRHQILLTICCVTHADKNRNFTLNQIWRTPRNRSANPSRLLPISVVAQFGFTFA